ncbi:MAG TPA: hypothetical protein VEC17_01830 [Candidatus Binatia bacterium]|nr:hypothetical protein [Candidatus Binatia bacterium]
MSRILLFSILLVVVYQFDELLKMLNYILLRVTRKEYRKLVLDSDRYVGTVLAIIGMPLALNYLLVSDQPLQMKLLIIAFLYVLFTILASGVTVFNKRLKHVEQYGQLVGMTYAVAGLFQPVIRTVPWYSGHATKELAKLGFLFCIPAFIGWGFKTYYDNNLFETEMVKYMDTAIIVMVGGLFVIITVKSLEKYLSKANLNYLGYLRIVLGAVLSVILFF